MQWPVHGIMFHLLDTKISSLMCLWMVQIHLNTISGYIPLKYCPPVSVNIYGIVRKIAMLDGHVITLGSVTDELFYMGM